MRRTHPRETMTPRARFLAALNRQKVDRPSVGNPTSVATVAVSYTHLDVYKRQIGVPMSDGGEGFAETLVLAKGGRLVPCTVTGPLGEPVEAFVGLLGDGSTGVVEMAAASGLPLVPAAKRNPFLTTTYGTGELIKNALSMGCRQIIIGAGGSATNDGGAGMVQALGARLLTDRGDDLKPGADGLRELADIDITGLDRRLQDVEIVLAADVHNPLCGEQGAAYTSVSYTHLDVYKRQVQCNPLHIGAGFLIFMGKTPVIQGSSNFPSF